MIDIKRLRSEKSLTQDDLAVTLGVSRAGISKYENGKDVSKHIEKLIFDKFPDASEYEVTFYSQEDFKVLKEKLRNKDREIKAAETLNKQLRDQLAKTEENLEFIKSLVKNQ